MGAPVFSTAVEICMQAYEIHQYLQQYILQKFGKYFLMTFILFLNVRT